MLDCVVVGGVGVPSNGAAISNLVVAIGRVLGVARHSDIQASATLR